MSRTDSLGPKASLDFEALSYTWGGPGAADKAFVAKPGEAAGGPPCSYIDIGQSLSEAMRHLRYTDRPRTLCIDAICISQADVLEKNQQVPRMGDIYRLANRVVARKRGGVGRYVPYYRRCGDKKREEKEEVESPEDPRLEGIPLPRNWEVTGRGLKKGDPGNARLFKNKRTGEVVNGDPRLFPDELRWRGVRVRMIELVLGGALG